jgi:ABC-2 type transport system ATP-binding protein
MHHPKILFLDEPTLGLDPQTRRVIWDHIRILNEVEKVTIILTTHYIEEADYLCNRVAIIDHGKIVALDRPDALKDRLKGDVVSINVSNPERYLSVVRKSKLVKGAKIVDGTMHLRVSSGERAIPKLLDLVNKHGGQVQTVSLNRPTLEDVFIHYTGRAIREEAPANHAHIGAMIHGWR